MWFFFLPGGMNFWSGFEVEIGYFAGGGFPVLQVSDILLLGIESEILRKFAGIFGSGKINFWSLLE